MDILSNFALTFVPLFVAVDAVGTLPVFVSLTSDLTQRKTKQIVMLSVATAMVVALLFLSVGKGLLNLLGITVADFMIAGGVLLFVFSLGELFAFEQKIKSIDVETVGAVPIGVPLIAGPAVFTSTLLLAQEYGYLSTIISLVINILIAGGLFWFAGPIVKMLGKAGAKTISKLASLLLAAIGVMIVRKGIMIFIQQ